MNKCETVRKLCPANGQHMNKKKWFISFLMIMSVTLVACSGGGSTSVEAVDLHHLVTPARLMVQSKEVYQMVQDAGSSRPDIEFEGPNQLEEEKRQEVESFLGGELIIEEMKQWIRRKALPNTLDRT